MKNFGRDINDDGLESGIHRRRGSIGNLSRSWRYKWKWEMENEASYSALLFHVGVVALRKLIFIVCPGGGGRPTVSRGCVENSHAHSFKSIISISHYAGGDSSSILLLLL